MSTSADDDDLDAIEPQQVLCSDTELTVTLKDGRRITTPLWWYPRLLHAPPKQRADYGLSPWRSLAGHRRGPLGRGHAARRQSSGGEGAELA